MSATTFKIGEHVQKKTGGAVMRVAAIREDVVVCESLGEKPVRQSIKSSELIKAKRHAIR
jgi:uncharacterized protein YodC (DUF2158 family)